MFQPFLPAAQRRGRRNCASTEKEKQRPPPPALTVRPLPRSPCKGWLDRGWASGRGWAGRQGCGRMVYIQTSIVSSPFWLETLAHCVHRVPACVFHASPSHMHYASHACFARIACIQGRRSSFPALFPPKAVLTALRRLRGRVTLRCRLPQGQPGPTPIGVSSLPGGIR